MSTLGDDEILTNGRAVGPDPTMDADGDDADSTDTGDDADSTDQADTTDDADTVDPDTGPADSSI